jgi:type II secretory pathway pseudopilin PulG
MIRQLMLGSSLQSRVAHIRRFLANVGCAPCSHSSVPSRRQLGSSLLELLVAVALFATISTAAFTLLYQQQNTAIGVNGQVQLSMSLRNAASMLQLDLANAGSNYYQASNISNGVIGVTMINNVVPPASGAGVSTICHTAGTTIYLNPCFDILNVIWIDPSYPVVNATDITGVAGSSNYSYTNSGNAYGQAGVLNPTSASPTTLTLAATASSYKVGDHLFLVKQNGSAYTSVVLTAVPTVASGSKAVLFTFQPTAANGTNTLQHDPLNITACSGASTCPPAAETTSPFTDSFSGSDYILKLLWATYQVCSGPGSPTTPNAPFACDQTATSPDIADPKLMRTFNGVTTQVMDQVIGFKAGGSVWNTPNGSADVTSYNYDSSTYTQNSTAGANAYNFTLLRSVRVSLIARTPPINTKNYVYRNAFDSGPYQVQGTVVVVNPRNMNF